MTKNVTLRMDDELLKGVKHMAVETGQSLSQWFAEVAAEKLRKHGQLSERQLRALDRLEKGLDLRPGRLKREELHERGADLR